jgi:hypothetical protein
VKTCRSSGADAGRNAQRIKTSHINARIIRDWQVVLACTVPDLSGTAQLLVGAGTTACRISPKRMPISCATAS